MAFEFKRVVLCVAMTGGVFLSGCGGSGVTSGTTPGPSPSIRSYLGTQSPGDIWSWSLTGSTFTAANQTSGSTYSGDSNLLTSGFYKLNVTSSSDSNAVGTSAYAFEVPGVAFVAKPVGTNSDPVVGASVGSCPTGTTADFNWITIPRHGWTPTDDAYGTAHFDITGNAANGTITKFALGGGSLPPNSGSFTCNNGILTTNDSSALITPAGIIMLDNGPGQGGVIGVAPASTNIDTAVLTNREFRGLLFEHGGGSEMVWVRSDGAGGLLGGSYTDIDNNVEDHTPGSTVDLTLTAQPSPGLMTGNLVDHNGTTPFTFVVNKVGGKYMLFGIAAAGGGASNFLVMEK